MAAGCSGGDWERIEETWDLQRYRVMQDHWLRVGPPSYILHAAEVGYRGTETSSGDEEIQDADQLAAALSSIPGGVVT